MTGADEETKPSRLAFLAVTLRGASTAIARLGKPPNEYAFERNVRDWLVARRWRVDAQVRSGDRSGRYDLVCRQPLPDGPIDYQPCVLELKMRLTSAHYKQFDRYMKSPDALPLAAVGWQASPAARRTLRDLSAEMPDRFQVVVISDGASLA